MLRERKGPKNSRGGHFCLRQRLRRATQPPQETPPWTHIPVDSRGAVPDPCSRNILSGRTCSPASPATEPDALEAQQVAAAGLHTLRAGVKHKENEVWRARRGVDMYTGASCADTKARGQQVDHIIEVQIVDAAWVATLNLWVVDGKVTRKEALHAYQLLRAEINGIANLNVTSKRVNQAKEGPIRAGRNRLAVRDGRLRTVRMEQLVRQGRNGWMLDDGTWDRVKQAIVTALNSIEEGVRRACIYGAPAPTTVALLGDTLDRMRHDLVALGLVA